MPESNIDFGLDGLGHQLADRRLAVPIYQRSYAWDSDEVEDFISDLQNAFGSEPQEYFLGTIVLSREGTEGRVSVIDGQQRLATLALLFAAMRDYFKANGQANRGTYVHRTYLSSYDDALDAEIPLLSLNADDDNYFSERIIKGNQNLEPRRDSHRLLLSAYEQLSDFISKIAASAGANWPQVLVDWRKFLHESVRVVHVTVPNESDAFLIFETLNDRGVDLTLADLLKNYLFGKAGAAKLDIVRNRWLTALAALDQDVALFIVFIRHFWSSYQGSIRERDLYKSIKNGVANQSQAVQFSEDLAEAARVYAALLSSEHEYWSGWGSTAKDNVYTIHRLALEQNRPMLLAVLQHFTPEEAKNALRASVGWSVRGLIVGGIGGGKTEKAYGNAAKEIRAGRIKTTAELSESLASILPSNDVFEASFAVARVTKAQLARYYLNALERQAAGLDQPELIPNANEEEVNLEHVLPKSADADDWPQFSDEERKDLVYRIGNLALLSKGPNDRIGNKPFGIKKPILQASALALTAEIGAQSDWTVIEIADRQKRLAQLAVSVWTR